MSNYSLSSSLEWLNGNMHRNYPIIDSAVPRSDTGMYLPSSLLMDMQLIVPYAEWVDPSKFFISAINREADSIRLVIGYMTSESQGFDCAITAAIPISLVYDGMDQTFDSHVIRVTAITTKVEQQDMDSQTYCYGIPDAYAALRGIRGTVYIGTCSDMVNAGPMRFDYLTTAIMPPCVYIEDAMYNVESVRFVDTYGTDETLTGDFTITLADGIDAVVSDNQSTVTFAINEQYLKDKLTDILSQKVGSAIQTINGMKPNDQGQFFITGLDCTFIDTTSNGLTIDNPCSKPCCDQNGADSAEILKALTDLAAAKDVLNNYYTDLATKVNLMQARLSSLIASRR